MHTDINSIGRAKVVVVEDASKADITNMTIAFKPVS
jgi:hypothetical protein